MTTASHNAITIRPATEKDISVLMKFIRLLAEHHGYLHKLKTTEESIKQHLFSEKPIGETVIAYLNDQPVGYALFTYNFSTLLGKPGMYAIDMFVVKEARRQGVGKQLFDYLKNVAKKRNYGRIDWSVWEFNQEAAAFYEAIGAKELKEWHLYRINID